MKTSRTFLAVLAAALLAACGGGLSGTYEGEAGTLTFDGSKVDLKTMASTVEMDYSTDGDKILLKMPQGSVVLTRNADGSIDTPWGPMKKKN
ncbi:hypothetical protein [Rhodanobacter lindaniclasticus]